MISDLSVVADGGCVVDTALSGSSTSVTLQPLFTISPSYSPTTISTCCWLLRYQPSDQLKVSACNLARTKISASWSAWRTNQNMVAIATVNNRPSAMSWILSHTILRTIRKCCSPQILVSAVKVLQFHAL